MKTLAHCFNISNCDRKMFLWEIFSVLIPVVCDAWYCFQTFVGGKKVKGKIKGEHSCKSTSSNFQLNLLKVTGPWRSLWVRLGYDPRKTKESKKYQLLDFRIRCSTKHGKEQTELLHSFWWGFCSSVVLFYLLFCLFSLKCVIYQFMETHLVKSFLPLLGYSVSDMPVKPKRSSLNYCLPITFNKQGE